MVTPIDGPSRIAVDVGSAPAKGVPDFVGALNVLFSGLLGQIETKQTSRPNESPATNSQRRNFTEKLTPSVEKIAFALTPHIKADLLQHGLETDPLKIRAGIAEAIMNDSMPLDKLKERKTFPVLAGYIGIGLLKPEERDYVLNLQKTLRQEWRAQNPRAAKGTEFTLYQVGDILKTILPPRVVNAADQLIETWVPTKK